MPKVIFFHLADHKTGAVCDSGVLNATLKHIIVNKMRLSGIDGIGTHDFEESGAVFSKFGYPKGHGFHLADKTGSNCNSGVLNTTIHFVNRSLPTYVVCPSLLVYILHLLTAPTPFPVLCSPFAISPFSFL